MTLATANAQTDLMFAAILVITALAVFLYWLVERLARALHAVVERVDGRSLRCEYEQRFAVDPHLSALAAAIRTGSLE
jgi:hypothetical protein